MRSLYKRIRLSLVIWYIGKEQYEDMITYKRSI